MPLTPGAGGHDITSPLQSPRALLSGNERGQSGNLLERSQLVLQQRNPSLCVLPYSVMLPKRPEGWIPSLLIRKLKHREGKQLAQRRTAGRWLSLNSNPLFLVSIPKWSTHLVGGWYLFDERMSELMNCPRSMAGQSRAGSSLSSRSQFLCFSAELWLSALMSSTFSSAPLPQDLKHLMCDVHYPPTPLQTKR